MPTMALKVSRRIVIDDPFLAAHKKADQYSYIRWLVVAALTSVSSLESIPLSQAREHTISGFSIPVLVVGFKGECIYI